MLQHIDRVAVVDQRIQAVAGGVLDLELVRDTLGQRRIGFHFVDQRRDTLQQMRMRTPKRLATRFIAGIDDAAIGEDQAHGLEGLIAVLRDTATHARGIVGRDTANLAGRNRRRIRPDLAIERRQVMIGLGADDARLQTDLPGILTELEITPRIAFEHDQHRIGDRLTGQAGACGAEGDRRGVAIGQAQQSRYLIFVDDLDDELRRQAVETGVRAVGQAAQQIVDQTLCRNELRKLGLEFGNAGYRHVICSAV